MKKRPIKSDLKKVDATKDEDIDYTDIPEFDAEFLRTVKLEDPPGKKLISLRVDEDVLEWMKKQGKGYQSRINALLRKYYEANREQAG